MESTDLLAEFGKLALGLVVLVVALTPGAVFSLCNEPSSPHLSDL